MKFLTYFLYLIKGFRSFVSSFFNTKHIAILIVLSLCVSGSFSSFKTSEYLTQALSFNLLFPQSAHAEDDDDNNDRTTRIDAGPRKNPEVATLEEEVEKLLSDIEKIKTELQKRSDNALENREQIRALKEDLDKANDRIRELTTQLDNAKKKADNMGELREDLDEEKRKLGNAEKEIQNLTAQLADLEEKLRLAEKNNLCIVDDKASPQTCFFALNGPDESQNINNQERRIPVQEEKDGFCFHCLNEEGISISCQSSSEKTAIKEFYACKGGSVSEAFEKMTKERCNGLVISGHHVGYYTGTKTKQLGHREAGQETLELNFLENLSCLKEEGSSNCQEWFSKIKYVHLHGSNTAELNIKPGNYDQTIRNKMRKYPSDTKWETYKARHINREYASTLDESNPLTSRYLRMFPQALVFGWSGQARTIEQGSPQEILNHMKAVGKIARTKGVSSENNNLNAFLDWLSEDHNGGDFCTENSWAENRGDDLLKNKLFSYEGDKNLSTERQLGCDLSNALRQGSVDNIKKVLKKITATCATKENKINCQNRLLSQNISRVISLFNKDSNLTQTEQKSIAQSVLDLFKDYDMNDVSIVRDADQIVLYKKLFILSSSKPSHEELVNDEKLIKYEEKLIERINNEYSKLGDTKVDLVYKRMLAELITKNFIGKTLANTKDSPLGEFIQKLKDEASSTNDPEIRKKFNRYAYQVERRTKQKERLDQ